ncbi:MAG TPA: nuclease [Sphingobium sp.]|uniref:nuclease n=1 Tax=Sphingobium sp. TaxID=1912891 RepID=UPI000EBD63BA|nr:nuclease [Sphingobium sp.]HAF41300.1 nuclease [Sphingobium sp.]
MARSLYEMGDRRPAEPGNWLNERRERRTRVLPIGLLCLVLVIAMLAAAFIGQALPSAEETARRAGTASISDRFALCDDLRGDACVLAADAYAWRGHRYHLSDISVPARTNARCPLEARRAEQGRIALAAMMNGGAFDARPDPADADPSARILARDGVSLGELMILKGHARPWSARPIDWCAA